MTLRADQGAPTDKRDISFQDAIWQVAPWIGPWLLGKLLDGLSAWFQRRVVSWLKLWLSGKSLEFYLTTWQYRTLPIRIPGGTGSNITCKTEQIPSRPAIARLQGRFSKSGSLMLPLF